MSYRRVALLVTVSSILMPAIVLAAQGQLASDLFKIQFGDNGITSLKRVKDVHDTEYITPGGALGNLVIRFKTPSDANWRVASLAERTQT